MVSVQYIVNDVDKATAFYRDTLDFIVSMTVPGNLPRKKLDDLTHYLSALGAGSGGQAAAARRLAAGAGL